MGRAGQTEITRIEPGGDISACLAIRNTVFVQGQGVPQDREIDGLDSASSHWLALVDGHPIATARARLVDGQLVKIERVAVLDRRQGSGIGMALMRRVMDDVKATWPEARPKLSAQVDVIGFYEKLGFVAEGPVYKDAGIDHRDMYLD